MVSAEDVRRVALSLPRAEEHLVHDRVKFRVGRLVFVSLSRDETAMGFGFPKEERAALVSAQPDKFFMPMKSDERYNWVRVWLDALEFDEMRELVVDAWCMCVPKKVRTEYFDGASPAGRGRPGAASTRLTPDRRSLRQSPPAARTPRRRRDSP